MVGNSGHDLNTGHKVHTLLKLSQRESSKQDSIKFEGVVFYKGEVCKIKNTVHNLIAAYSLLGRIYT